MRGAGGLPRADEGRPGGQLQLVPHVLYDWLDEVVDEAVLAHPKKVRAIPDARIKTDKIDSEMAHLLRADLIPAAYARPKDVRAIKRLVGQRL